MARSMTPTRSLPHPRGRVVGSRWFPTDKSYLVAGQRSVDVRDDGAREDGEVTTGRILPGPIDHLVGVSLADRPDLLLPARPPVATSPETDLVLRLLILAAAEARIGTLKFHYAIMSPR